MPRTYSSVAITAGSGTAIDTVQTSLDSDQRQIVVLGDPDTDTQLLAIDASGRAAVAEADGANVTIGAKADTLLLTGTASLIALIKGLISLVPQSLGQKTSAASMSVVLASDQGTTPDTLSASATVGTALSTYFNNALLAAATSVKASAGKLHGWYFYNPNTSDAWVQMFDLATGSVTLGTTAPKKSIWVPAGGESDHVQPLGINHATAITIAATTTSNGSVAPATGLVINADYI